MLFRFGFTRFVVVVVVVVVVLRRMLFRSLYVSHMASFSRRMKDIVFFSEHLSPATKIDVLGNSDGSCSFNNKLISAIRNYTRKPQFFPPHARNYLI